MTKVTQTLLSTTFLLMGINLQAQTLTCQYNCPQVGQMFSTKTSSPAPHISGQNQLWNFTNLLAQSSFVTEISYVDPLTVSSSSLYTQATVAKEESGQYTFLNASSNGINISSLANATVNALSLLLPLPFSYGSTHSETISTSVMNGTNVIIYTQTKKIDGVGTGTLMLPSGTYTDVLRISGKTVESRTKNGLPEGYILTTQLNYYYSEKIAHPLLFEHYRSETGPADYAPFTQFISKLPTGIREQYKDSESGLNISPNPGSDKVNIASLINEPGEITLSNSLGQIVLKQNYSGTDTELELTKLPEGLYTLLITQKGQVQTKKMVISR